MVAWNRDKFRETSQRRELAIELNQRICSALEFRGGTSLNDVTREDHQIPWARLREQQRKIIVQVVFKIGPQRCLPFHAEM
ncbi:hypothetical protein D9M72_361300 [compost metagenome]